MDTSHDELLLQEMKTFALRYGTDKLQKAVDSVKLALAPKVLTKKYVPCVTLWVPCRGCGQCEAVRHLVESSLCQPTKVNLNLHLTCRGILTELEEIMAMMEECYDSITGQQAQQQLHRQRPFDPMTKIQRVESCFDTLNFSYDQSLLLQRKKCFALFKTVVLRDFSFGDPDPYSLVEVCDFFDRFMELILKDGLIPSLKFEYCEFGVKQARQVARLLEENLLEALEFSDVELDRHISPFIQFWTQSLNKHIEKFAQVSMLKVLKLHDVWNGMEFGHYQELFQLIGNLPNLQSVKIVGYDEDLHDALCGSIGSWSIRQFTFVCGDIELQPLLDAVASSRNLKVFDFRASLSVSMAGQVFDLALSPTSGLLEICLRGSLNLRQLSWLVPEEADPTVTLGPQLRRFSFVQNEGQIEHMFEDGDDEALLLNLQALLRLFSKQIPFLHSIGSVFDDWILDREMDNILPKSPLFCNLWNQLLVQIEKNRVGMALFEAATLPLSTVPAGLWSVVLHRAIIYDEDARNLPWTGIYHMVRRLFERGHSGLMEGDKKRRWSADGITDDNDRPKRDGAKVA
jgi:hypothetical protein